MLACLGGALGLALLTSGSHAQDTSGLKVPGGLRFADFHGYEDWAVISISQNHGLISVILGNPLMIAAFRKGIPENGRPFPDGARMAKIHWNPKTNELAPGNPTVPGTLHDVDFMVKDSRRFADSGGWGYGAFRYDEAAGTFRPSNTSDTPPQQSDAKCGAACHTAARNRDYVFTEYGRR